MDTQMPETPKPETPKKAGTGGTLAIIVIVLLLLAGGYYYFTAGIGGLDMSNDAMTTEEEGAMLAEPDVAALEAQGTSDNIADIEADLGATDLSGLDEATADFEGELQTQ